MHFRISHYTTPTVLRVRFRIRITTPTTNAYHDDCDCEDNYIEWCRVAECLFSPSKEERWCSTAARPRVLKSAVGWRRPSFLRRFRGFHDIIVVLDVVEGLLYS